MMINRPCHRWEEVLTNATNVVENCLIIIAALKEIQGMDRRDSQPSQLDVLDVSVYLFWGQCR